MRLHKFLAEAGVASRRKAEELIVKGHVTVNGVIAELGMSVNDDDVIMLDNSLVKREQNKIVIMLNKPKGVICSADDPEKRRTVFDLVEGVPCRVYNVGRLDINSEGLILLTNDGELTHALTHPSHEVEKTYLVLCDGLVTESERLRLESGVMLEDGLTAPARVSLPIHIDGDRTKLSITIHEGRNRQVRRMLTAIGHNTLRLRRVRLGPLSLNGLKSGQWRYLSPIEVASLYKAAGLRYSG